MALLEASGQLAQKPGYFGAVQTSPLEFLNRTPSTPADRETGSAKKGKLLQGKVLMPVRLLHKGPSQGRKSTPVGDPAHIQSPSEDLANKDTRGLMGQRDPQHGRDTLPDGFQSGRGGIATPAAQNKAGKTRDLITCLRTSKGKAGLAVCLRRTCSLCKLSLSGTASPESRQSSTPRNCRVGLIW